MTTTVVTLEFDRFDELMAQFGNETEKAVQETLFEIETHTKLNAPVDTGLLRSSYQSELTGRGEGAVFTNTEYAEHVEFGTSRMPAHPHLGPAAESARPSFMRRMQAIGSMLR